jgi:hypothetical protein
MPTYTGERVAGFTPGQVDVQRNIAGLTTPGGFADARSGLGMGSGLGFGTAGAGPFKSIGLYTFIYIWRYIYSWHGRLLW